MKDNFALIEEDGRTAVMIQHYEVVAITEGGEEKIRTKINPNKRHSKNNTIIGFNIYADGVWKFILWK